MSQSHIDMAAAANALEAEYLAVANGDKKPGKLDLQVLVRAVQALREGAAPISDPVVEREAPSAASAQQNDGGDETKWNCHCGNANCAGLHPDDASAQQDEPTPAQPISDAMMDLVDRLGSEAANVDPRAWRHLLVYAPKAAQQDEREADAKALKDASEWLLDVMGDWDFTIPSGAFDKIVVYIAKGDHNG